ncbi:helix-turn-helix transcriptional regulator [Stenoxybacter acetivorans]|uniref:helix-turn-helix transcriptional regulator n=1 Tax=Stenoxybacter acetivorans TaxID=422441 RepID=UPI00056A7BB9|nr:AlpA family phage regulatory protein [Stenoxybacter acetivorans]
MATEEFIRITEVKKLIGLKSSSAIWFKLNPNYPNRYDPTFPRPIKVGRASCWAKSEIETWQQAMLAARPQPK